MVLKPLPSSFLSGFPQPEYRWLKDGVFLSDFTSEPFYKILSISRGDAGNYQCYARNKVGTIVSEKIPVTVACEYFKFKRF
jgi:protein sidekick